MPVVLKDYGQRMPLFIRKDRRSSVVLDGCSAPRQRMARSSDAQSITRLEALFLRLLAENQYGCGIAATNVTQPMMRCHTSWFSTGTCFVLTVSCMLAKHNLKLLRERFSTYTIGRRGEDVCCCLLHQPLSDHDVPDSSVSRVIKGVLAPDSPIPMYQFFAMSYVVKSTTALMMMLSDADFVKLRHRLLHTPSSLPPRHTHSGKTAFIPKYYPYSFSSAANVLAHCCYTTACTAVREQRAASQ